MSRESSTSISKAGIERRAGYLQRGDTEQDERTMNQKPAGRVTLGSFTLAAQLVQNSQEAMP